MERIFLANVGINASHSFSSPIFADGTFEFIPIPENQELSGRSVERYRDLTSFNHLKQDLKKYVPDRLWDWPTHNDPEFTTFTYGDNCETTPRAASLKKLEAKDILFFLARLTGYQDGKSTNRNGFYLIGYLEIEEILRNVSSKPPADVLSRFAANSHVRRGLSDAGLWDHFWTFRGSERSRRFPKAVPVNRTIASQIFTSADGSDWKWDGDRSDLQVIGSYTRSCRCVIDPNIPGHSARAAALWKWIDLYN